MFNRFAQRVPDHFMPTNPTLDKRFNIERLKALGATTFKGTTHPADLEKWLSLIEKGFKSAPKRKKVKLATFLL